MRLVMDTPKLAIYDDVLNDKDFKETWKYVQNERYVQPHNNEWIKVWRVTDGTPLGSRSYKYTERPFNSPLDIVCDKVLEGANAYSHLLGRWNEIHLRCYLYGRGTRLSWHNDHNYSGACIFYPHLKWGSTWGGELMVAEMPKELPELPDTSPHLDNRWEDAVLEAYGMGTYITAKPNRMVFTSGSVWHTINRVDDDAGNNVRCSIVCFFEQNEEVKEVEPKMEIPLTPVFPNLKPIQTVRV